MWMKPPNQSRRNFHTVLLLSYICNIVMPLLFAGHSQNNKSVKSILKKKSRVGNPSARQRDTSDRPDPKYIFADCSYAKENEQLEQGIVPNRLQPLPIANIPHLIIPPKYKEAGIVTYKIARRFAARRKFQLASRHKMLTRKRRREQEGRAAPLPEKSPAKVRICEKPAIRKLGKNKLHYGALKAPFFEQVYYAHPEQLRGEPHQPGYGARQGRGVGWVWPSRQENES